MALNSTSVIRFVDLLCEGPIAGLVGTEEGIFLMRRQSAPVQAVTLHRKMFRTISSLAAERRPK